MPHSTNTLKAHREWLINGGKKLAVYRWGDPGEKPPILLIHGYPDNASVWNEVVKHLSPNREVFSYDIKGIGDSDKPDSHNDYVFSALIDDLSLVLDYISPNRPAHLVGHDWGALQVWEAARTKALQTRIASISVAAPAIDHISDWTRRRLRKPTPKALLQALKQAGRSSYILFFHLPVVPELSWQLFGHKLWPMLLERNEGIAPHRHSINLADAKNGLWLYRKNVIPKLKKPNLEKTSHPVQILCMNKDPFLLPTLYENSAKFGSDISQVDIEAGHWAILTHAKEVSDAVTNFIVNIENRPSA